jgi:predicted transcriptional regulator
LPKVPITNCIGMPYTAFAYPELTLVGNGHPHDGLLSLAQINAMARTRWPTTRVEHAMTPASRLKTTAPDTALVAIMEQMRTLGEQQFVVIDGARPVGVVTPDTVLRFLRAREEQPVQLLHSNS